MTEARFWVIYFTMVKRLLPPEAFADAPQLPRTSSAGSSAAAAASGAASAVAAAASSAFSSLGISRSNSKVSTPVKRAGSGATSEAPFGAQQQQQQQQQPGSATAAAAAAAVAASSGGRAAELRGREGSGTTEHTSEVLVEMPGASAEEEEEDPDGLGELENDAELEAYLQEALQVGAAGGRWGGLGARAACLCSGAAAAPQAPLTAWRGRRSWLTSLRCRAAAAQPQVKEGEEEGSDVGDLDEYLNQLDAELGGDDEDDEELDDDDALLSEDAEEGGEAKT
jgi:hypothetical protein